MNKGLFITATRTDRHAMHDSNSPSYVAGETIISSTSTPELTIEIPDNESTRSLQQEETPEGMNYEASIEKEQKKRNYTRHIYDMQSEYEEGFSQFLAQPEKILGKDQELFFFQFRKAIKNKDLPEIHGFMAAMVEAHVADVIIQRRKEKEAKTQKTLEVPGMPEKTMMTLDEQPDTPTSIMAEEIDQLAQPLSRKSTMSKLSRKVSSKNIMDTRKSSSNSRLSKRSTSTNRKKHVIRSRLPSPRALNGNSELIVDVSPYTDEEQTFIENMLSNAIFKDASHWKGQCPLHQAVELGDYQITKYLLGYFNVNVHDSITQTSALHIAIERDHKTIIMLLCKLGADIDYCTALLEAPLIQAIRLQNEVVVDLLLFQFHANPNRFQKNIRQTPFVVCCEKGNRTIFELLRKARCNIDRITGYEGENALHYFCRTGNAQAIRMLLEKRRFHANVHTINKHGFAPIHLACDTADRDDIVSILLKHGAALDEPMQSVSGDPGTPLSISVAKSHHQCTKCLLNHGADINKVIQMTLSEHQKTVMAIACEMGDHLLASLLLKYEPNLEIPKERPPLVVAAQRGHLTICRLLLENHASTNVTFGDDQSTPLHLASQHGHVKIVRLLLKFGADASAQTKSFDTALHIAAKAGHRAVAQVLLHHGQLDVTKRNRLRQTALHVACQKKHFHIVELLLRHKAKKESSFQMSSIAPTTTIMSQTPFSQQASTLTPGSRFSSPTSSRFSKTLPFLHRPSHMRSKLSLKKSTFLPILKSNKPIWS